MDIVKAEASYLQRMKSKNWSEKTVKNYLSQIRIFLKEFENKTRAKEINANEIEAYLLDKVNINSRNHARCSINAFYKLVIGQPEKLKYIPWPKKEKKLIEFLDSSEVQMLLSKCINLKHKAIIMLMYGSGLRVSEVINLKICDIDSKQMLIRILQGKGKKDRVVQLDSILLDFLRKYYTEYKPKNYLFNGQFSDQYTERSINQFLKKYAKDGGLKRNVHAHLLRHSFATSSLEMGTDIRFIQKVLGHSNIKTTIDYTHVSSGLIRKTPSPLQLL
jgi:integrase/recombinase XerD